MSRRAGLLLATVLAVGLASSLMGDEPALPDGLKGFRGMLRGTLVSKAEDSFVLKVDKVLRVWKANTASDPGSAAGRELTLHLNPDSPRIAKFREALAGLNVGDPVVAEAFNTEGDRLVVVETLRKGEAEVSPEEQIARLKARVAELEKQVAELKAENDRLKKQLAEARALD